MIRIPLTLLGLEGEVESSPEPLGPIVKRRKGSGELARWDGGRRRWKSGFESVHFLRDEGDERFFAAYEQERKPGQFREDRKER